MVLRAHIAFWRLLCFGGQYFAVLPHTSYHNEPHLKSVIIVHELKNPRLVSRSTYHYAPLAAAPAGPFDRDPFALGAMDLIL